MGLFKRKPTLEELEEERQRVAIEEELATRRASIAEREAVIAELKKRYGKNWMSILGLNKLTDLETLRSFLRDAKRGLEAQARSNYVRNIVDFSKIPKA